MTTKIAFVGVGRMGANMARRLKEVGYPVTAVYDANAATAQTLATELGCRAAAKLAEVTASADVIITVVTDDAAMKKSSRPRVAEATRCSPTRAAKSERSEGSTLDIRGVNSCSEGSTLLVQRGQLLTIDKMEK